MSEISLNVLQAESFQLVDERGEIIAVLASSADQRPNLLLFDKNGKPAVSLGVNTSDEPACTLVAGNNNATISLSLNEGQPLLLLTSKDGTPRASLTLITNDEPVLSIVKMVRLSAHSWEPGQQSFSLHTRQRLGPT